MHDLYSAQYRMDDTEAAARRAIAQARRSDRARTFGEIFADLVSVVAQGFAPFGAPERTAARKADPS